MNIKVNDLLNAVPTLNKLIAADGMTARGLFLLARLAKHAQGEIETFHTARQTVQQQSGLYGADGQAQAAYIEPPAADAAAEPKLNAAGQAILDELLKKLDTLAQTEIEIPYEPIAIGELGRAAETLKPADVLPVLWAFKLD